MLKVLALTLLLLSCGQETEKASTIQLAGAPEHIHLRKDSRSSPKSRSPLLTNHGGSVLHTSKTKAIFWGSQWSSSSFASDKIGGIDLFFSGFSGSEYASTGNEYSDSTGHVTSTSTYLGHVLDLSAAPTHALTSSSAISKACSVTSNNPDPLALYLIYTATTAGQVNYCAWHSWGTCSNGKQIQVAYMPNLDNIAGCDPQDSLTGHSEGLAALVNVTAHELMETITDPRGTAWFDSSGEEDGDKCAWAFAPVLEQLSNGTQWKLQMEWSNAAYNTSTGLPNLSSQKGCIY